MKIVALIQARMNSSRLKGKMLMPLAKKPLIEWVLEGVCSAEKLDKVVLCTSTKKENDPLETSARKLGVEVFRGSEDDVLGRFVDAGEKYRAEVVVRVCGDNPLVCGAEIDRLVEHFQECKADYSFNHIPKLENGYPDGLGAEIVDFKVLKKINEIPELHDRYREHVTSYIWEKSDEFNISVLKALDSFAYPQVKLDIDTQEDFEFLDRLIKSMVMKNMNLNDPAVICREFLKLQGDR